MGEWVSEQDKVLGDRTIAPVLSIAAPRVCVTFVPSVFWAQVHSEEGRVLRCEALGTRDLR